MDYEREEEGDMMAEMEAMLYLQLYNDVLGDKTPSTTQQAATSDVRPQQVFTDAPVLGKHLQPSSQRLLKLEEPNKPGEYLHNKKYAQEASMGNLFIPSCVKVEIVSPSDYMETHTGKKKASRSTSKLQQGMKQEHDFGGKFESSTSPHSHTPSCVKVEVVLPSDDMETGKKKARRSTSKVQQGMKQEHDFEGKFESSASPHSHTPNCVKVEIVLPSDDMETRKKKASCSTSKVQQVVKQEHDFRGKFDSSTSHHTPSCVKVEIVSPSDDLETGKKKASRGTSKGQQVMKETLDFGGKPYGSTSHHTPSSSARVEIVSPSDYIENSKPKLNTHQMPLENQEREKSTKKPNTPKLPLVKQELDFDENDFDSHTDCRTHAKNLTNSNNEKKYGKNIGEQNLSDTRNKNKKERGWDVGCRPETKSKVNQGVVQGEIQTDVVLGSEEKESNKQQLKRKTIQGDGGVKVKVITDDVVSKQGATLTCNSKKSKSTVQPKFDLEELGIAQSPFVKLRGKQPENGVSIDDRACDSQIDTLTIKPKKKLAGVAVSEHSSDELDRQFVYKNKLKTLTGVPKAHKITQGILGAVYLGRQKPRSSNYRKSLARILSSHSCGQKSTEIAVISSNSSDSESSDSASTKSTASSTNTSDGTPTSSNYGIKSAMPSAESLLSRSVWVRPHSFKIADSDSDSSVGAGLQDSGLRGNSSCKGGSEALCLDLAWNINRMDKDTIKTVENQVDKGKDLKWQIDRADIQRSRVSRYYVLKRVQCHNCNKEGHLSKTCPEPRKKPNCFLCGFPGHSGYRCPNRLCLNCFQPGHRGDYCRQKRRDRFAICPRCGMNGHNEQECPDLWRQYHATLPSSETLVKSGKNINPKVYCCNCAQKGHLSFQCRGRRMDQYVFATYPHVVRYDATYGSILGTYKGTSRTQSCHFNSNEPSPSPPKKSRPEEPLSRQSCPSSTVTGHVNQSKISATSIPSRKIVTLPSASSTVSQSPCKGAQESDIKQPGSCGLAREQLPQQHQFLQSTVGKKKLSAKKGKKAMGVEVTSRAPESAVQGSVDPGKPGAQSSRGRSGDRCNEGSFGQGALGDLSLYAPQFWQSDTLQPSQKPRKGQRRKLSAPLLQESSTLLPHEGFAEDPTESLRTLIDRFKTMRHSLTDLEKASLKVVFKKMKRTYRQVERKPFQFGDQAVHIGADIWRKVKAIARKLNVQIRRSKKKNNTQVKLHSVLSDSAYQQHNQFLRNLTELYQQQQMVFQQKACFQQQNPTHSLPGPTIGQHTPTQGWHNPAPGRHSPTVGQHIPAQARRNSTVGQRTWGQRNRDIGPSQQQQGQTTLEHRQFRNTEPHLQQKWSAYQPEEQEQPVEQNQNYLESGAYCDMQQVTPQWQRGWKRRKYQQQSRQQQRKVDEKPQGQRYQCTKPYCEQGAHCPRNTDYGNCQQTQQLRHAWQHQNHPYQSGRLGQNEDTPRRGGNNSNTQSGVNFTSKNHKCNETYSQGSKATKCASAGGFQTSPSTASFLRACRRERR